MAKFKVGDKVRAKKDAPYSITTDGWIGEVVKVYDNSYSDEDIRVFGEDALGLKENKNGFSVESKYFDLVEDSENKIVITTDGKTTTAVLYNGKQRIKDAKAVCAPGDTFDFNYGASLALDRLIRQACGKKADAVYIDEGFKSQMDKFMAGDIVIKVPDGKTMDFLKELEKKNEKLRWHSGQKPTKWGHHCKYFSIDIGGLGYIDKCDLHMVHRPVEIWNDVESTSDVPHVIRAIAAFEALMKLMKDEFDD